MRFSRPIVKMLAAIVMFGITASGQAETTTWYVDEAVPDFQGAVCVSRTCCNSNPERQLGTEEYPFCDIQSGIDAAADGDTVLVADGTYKFFQQENVSLDFNGKKITVRSINGPEQCILDPRYDNISQPVVDFHSAENSMSVFDGFKIISSVSSAIRIRPLVQGGVRVNSSPTIQNCIIEFLPIPFPLDPLDPPGPNINLPGPGAGININAGTATIRNCVIRNNVSRVWGGGIYMVDATGVAIIGCTITGNIAFESGGGVYARNSVVSLVNCVIADNSVLFPGGRNEYLIPWDDLINLGDSAFNCSNDSWYNLGCAGDIGFTWNDTGHGIADSVRIDFNIGYDCHLPGTTHNTFLNGIEVQSYSSVPQNCTCDPYPEGWVGTIDGPGSRNNYNVGEPNIFMISSISTCIGLQARQEWAFNYARVVASYASSMGTGGGIFFTDSAGPNNVINCLIVGNQAAAGAGVAAFSVRDLSMTNCTLTENIAGTGVGGALLGDTTTILPPRNIRIANSILWGNGGSEIFARDGRSPHVTYSDVKGGYDGEGNIKVNPLFMKVVSGMSWEDNDYRLDTGSLCSDAGDNTAVPADLLVDLDGERRILDNREVDDSGVRDGHPEGVVDMGVYELTPWCLGEELRPPEDIIDKVEYAATASAPSGIDPPSGIYPSTGAFYHACVPDPNFPSDGDTCDRKAIFAAEARSEVTITWKYRENEDDETPLDRTETYRVGRCVRDYPTVDELGYTIVEASFFKAYPEANVVVSDLYDVTVRYNSLISENLPQGPDDIAEEPDITVLSTGQVSVSDNSPDGMVVLEYNHHLGGKLVGFEVINITSDGASLFPGPIDGSVPIGRKLTPPALTRTAAAEAENCRAVVIRNHERDGVAVAWQRRVDTNDIYSIRPEIDSFAFIVGWYEGTPLDNCWPVAVHRYTTRWPVDPPPQLHIIDRDAGQGGIPTGSVVDLRTDIYCSTEILYQQGITGDDSNDDEPYSRVLPYSHIVAGAFAARQEGYTVLRLDIQPDEISDCGEEVAFEVIESRDREHPTKVFFNNGTEQDDANVGWDIGEQLVCVGSNCGCSVDCDDYFDEEAQTYPFGFLFIRDGQHSAPYAGNIYEETGQIIPVNESCPDGWNLCEDATNHGLLEAWWYEEGEFAKGIYWPNKLATYDAQWIGLDSPIVIASRRGPSDYPDGMDGGYPLGSLIYKVGSFDDRNDEYETHGWNPNDEHGILLTAGGKLKIYAVRNDNPWEVETGHPYVLVQYRDPQDEALWRMGVHHVEAEDATDDFYYDSYRVDDENCGDCVEDVCKGGPANDQECLTDDDCCEMKVLAGHPVDPLFPVNFGPGECMDGEEPMTWVDYRTGDALWVDRKGGIWAREEWDDDESVRDACEDDSPLTICRQSTAWIYIWENWGEDCSCQPWLADGPGPDSSEYNETCEEAIANGRDPWEVIYDPSWPVVDKHPNENLEEDLCIYPDDSKCAPLRHIGASFDQSGQCGSIELLHDTVGVRILDPTYEVRVPYEPGAPFDPDFFAPLPPHLYNGEIGGGGEWPDRIRYDFGTNELVFRGVMSPRDQEELKALNRDNIAPAFPGAVEELYTLSRVQIGDSDLGENIGYCDDGGNDGKACPADNNCPNGDCKTFEATAGKFISLADQGAEEGWVTMAFQNDQECVDQGLPISLEAWRVECPPDKGHIKVIVPQCPLSEKLVLRFSGDGGGKPEKLYFQWQWADYHDSFAPENTEWHNYKRDGFPEDELGNREVLIEGASEFTLIDTYWRVRYRGYVQGCPCNDDNPGECNEGDDLWLTTLEGPGSQISDWTEVQLAEGWVKRVIRGINPFDQRIENFHVNEAATYVDMIRQAGKAFTDPVPLNCNAENINAIGLIELYETVLRRAKKFLLDLGRAEHGVIKALLLVTGKIADLNMLLGNEAYADALDPTIGVFADQGDISSSYDPHAVFCFEEQVDSVLEEELALLRGRSFARDPDYDVDNTLIATVYNRLPWNFTSGNGQIAYANNYQLTDIEEAMATYPQGHGDAWGYYLTAIRKFYLLLQDSVFEWENIDEHMLVAGQPVPVGMKYERKFAVAAASRARTGAAITSLTFRQLSSSDPLEQQGGYPDPDPYHTDPERAWGVADWGRRAGQGAYLDWLVANALLPAEDTTNEGIQKIDRTTVLELREIAASYTEIQTILDKADAGLNPLGLASNVVPFGLNPSDLEEGQTHFDQITQHALVALANAGTAFDYANSNTQRLRSMGDNLDDFENLIDERELDFTARLIEIFGSPYKKDIGFGGAYPDGYRGPDIFHFAYMDSSVLLEGEDVDVNRTTNTTTVEVVFTKPNFAVLGGATGELTDGTTPTWAASDSLADELEELDEWVVWFNVSTDGLGLVKPPAWGTRPEPGEIQFSRGELLQVVGSYQQALLGYEAAIDQIQDQVDLLSSLFGLNAEVLGVMIEGRDEQERLNGLIYDARGAQLIHRHIGSVAVIAATAAAETLRVFDPPAPARSAMRLVGSAINEAMGIFADLLAIKELQLKQDKELVSLNQKITITGLQSGYQEQQQVVALKQMIRGLALARLQLYTLEEAIKQGTGRYHSALGRGLRLLEQRTAFRQRTADQISKYRYRDMAFRVFRNDALQKYRAQFDLAARYTFLAAKAYDYETNLLRTDSISGQRFQEAIVRERSLGVISNGVPFVGNGLAGRLAEMAANFDVLRSELGFNNKDRFQRTFSLRWELFRISPTVDFDWEWRSALSGNDPNHVVLRIPDLNDWDVYRQYCQPLLPLRDPEPAIVIPFSTTLASGLNLFGKDSKGDEILPPDRFAIKIHSLSVGLSQSYASPPLNRQVHVYLIPTGVDIMRVPTDGSIREWNVLDQSLPVPFPVSEAELQRPDWMPWDSLVGGSAAMAHRRRLPTVTACPVTEEECDLNYKLIGRSIWNTQWYLIIPGSQLMGEDPEQGIDLFINGEFGTGVRDLKLTFELYGYSGDVPANLAASGGP